MRPRMVLARRVARMELLPLLICTDPRLENAQ
jgi:hypothetical protein